MTDLTEVKTVGIVFYIYIVRNARSLLQLSHLFPPYHSNAKENPYFLLEQQPLLQHHQFKHPLEKNNKGKRYNMSSTDAPAGDVQDNSYVNRPGQNEYNVPVVKDDTAAAATEEGGYTDETTADSDAQLGIFHLSLLLPLSFSFTHTHTHKLKLTNPLLLSFFFLFHPSLSHTLTLTLTPNNSKRRSRHRQNQHSRIENSWSSKGSRILYRAGR